MRSPVSQWLVRSASLTLGLALAGPAPGQSIWQGGTGTGWMTAANWQGNVAPVSSNTTALQFNGTTNLASNNDFAGTFSLNSMSFGAAAGPYTITGNPLLFTGTTPAITNASSSLITVGNAITFNTGG